MPSVQDNGRTNPMVIVTQDEVLAWLREQADKLGYSDRRTVGVQTTLREGLSMECPRLLLMVSNIPNSREAKT